MKMECLTTAEDIIVSAAMCKYNAVVMMRPLLTGAEGFSY